MFERTCPRAHPPIPDLTLLPFLLLVRHVCLAGVGKKRAKHLFLSHWGFMSSCRHHFFAIVFVSRPNEDRHLILRCRSSNDRCHTPVNRRDHKQDEQELLQAGVTTNSVREGFVVFTQHREHILCGCDVMTSSFGTYACEKTSWAHFERAHSLCRCVPVTR